MCIKWDEWQPQPGHVPVFRSAPWSLIMGNIWDRHEIYAYLKRDGQLGKLTINVVIIATTMLAQIFCVLCQVTSPLHIDHRGCLIGTATNHRRACIFLMTTRHSMFGRGGDCDVTTPPCPIRECSLEKKKSVLLMTCMCEQPPVVVVQWVRHLE